MNETKTQKAPAYHVSRRRFLNSGLAGLGLCAAQASGIPLFFGRAAQAIAAQGARDRRILVVLELSGGNDGLNTLVPYGDDAYYRHRPKLGIRPGALRKIDDHYGFNSGMSGFEKLYKDGHLAVVQGCGYAGPSFSHFTSMAYWHTAAPNSGEETGWVGRLADALDPANTPNFLVNIDETQSLAVRSRLHAPVVFDDPDRFARKTYFEERDFFADVPAAKTASNAQHEFLLQVARSANDASALVREAWARYRKQVDYGVAPLDLPKIAALIEAGLPTRLYYTSFRHNAFDTHVYQANLHGRLLTYVSDAVSGFMRDLERMGRAEDVAILMFSEFGRRVPENDNLGTDHGTAGLMFVAGKGVKGGHYGERPSLTELDDGNLIYTTDFRRVYASVIQGWLGHEDTKPLLKGEFRPFPMFG
jgi:uncharacterized protein (DUF1501 family)